MKSNRRDDIKRIIKEQKISTQEELQAKLEEYGYYVTQATISRDVRELKIVKRVGSSGNAFYCIDADDLNEKYTNILRNGISTSVVSENMVVIRTISGTAMAVASAIDEFEWEEVLGTIAGDDTIFTVARSKEDALKLNEKLEGYYGRN